MTTSADVIAAINQRRTRLTIRPETPGALPPGWQGWLDAMPVVDAHAEGAPAPSLVAALVERPLRAIPKSPSPLGRWRSFATLLQQQWQPDAADERGMRIGAGAVDILLHLILVSLLLWLMYLQFMMPPPPQDEGEAVQVEFIGRGNVAEGGGALANAGAESAAAAAPANRAATPSPATGTPDAPIASVPMPSQPKLAASSEAPERVRELPPPAVAEAAQPLQVSEVREPEPQSFQLPPPKPVELQLPQVQLRDVQPMQAVEAIATLQPQPVRTLKPREIKAELQAPQLQQQVQDIQVPEPQRLATLPARALPTQATRSVEVPQLRGEVSEIPMPPGGAPTPSAQAGNGRCADRPARRRARVASVAMRPPPESRPREQGRVRSRPSKAAVVWRRRVAGAGPGIKAAPGGWPGAAKTDDWGASTRNVAGTGTGDGKGTGKGRDGDGKPGLFNGDGSPRLSDKWTEQTGIDLDRAGTWLKRPGLEYRATRFDRYWIPQGTLLEEWVRRGIKQVSIPIPGTSRRLQCVISLLQLGGGCLPVDPDVNEQPARARPPPDIPFKPELQEDNGSVKPTNP